MISFARIRRAGPIALLWCLWMVGLGDPVLGQTGSVEVTGTVVDSTGAGMPRATVVVLNASDSVMVGFAATRADGSFRIRRVPRGAFVLQVTFVGYAAREVPFAVTGEPVDLGSVVLDEAVSSLDELVVSAEHVPMRIRTDTIEYNAAAFAVPPNANVEDLLKRLPGIDVERDGSIRAQGEQVEQVLVDGKEFFGQDPTIATRNLPADAVDRVQVYDKLSDMAEFTGVEDGDELRTINLALKEDRKNGLFGNVSGGYGDQNRYDGNASVNRFSPSTQLSFIGNLNNVNRQGFSIGDYMRFMGGMQALVVNGGGMQSGGVPLGTDITSGYTTTSAGGLNANVDLGARTSLRSSYFLSRLDASQDRSVRQQQLLGASLSSLMVQNGLQESLSLNHRLNLVLRHRFGEGHDLRFRTDFRVGSSSLDNRSDRETFGVADTKENASETVYDSSGDDLGGDAALTYRRRLNDVGTTVVAEARTDLSQTGLDGDLEALNTYYQPGDIVSREEIAQFQSLSGSTLSHTQSVSLAQPLGKKKLLEAHAERREVSEDQDKSFFDVESGQRTLNDLLSSAFDRSYLYHRAGANFRRVGRTLNVSFGLDVQGSELTGEVLDAGTAISRRFVRWLPTASMGYEFKPGVNLDLRYETSTREPSMRELQPFADNSDPLNIYTGNPDLRPEYAHSLNARYLFFDQFTFTNLFAFIRATYTTNTIVRSRTVDERLRQTLTSVNGGGDWMVVGSMNFGTPLRPLRTKINLSNRILYNRGLEIINGADNVTSTVRNTVDLRLENRNKDVVDLSAGARYSFNTNRYSLNRELGKDYVNRTFYADGTLYLGENWRFSSEFDYQVYSKEVFGSSRSVPLWGAEVSRMMLKQKAELQLVAFDLLNRNLGVNYINAGGFVREEQIRSLGRYVLLKFVYHLSRSGAAREGIHIEMMGD